MLELIPCALGAIVALVSATRVAPRAALVLASLAGAAVAVVSGEAAAWPPAILLDATLALAAGAVVAVVRHQRANT